MLPRLVLGLGIALTGPMEGAEDIGSRERAASFPPLDRPTSPPGSIAVTLQVEGWPRRLSWDDFQPLNRAPADSHGNNARVSASLDVVESGYTEIGRRRFQLTSATVAITLEKAQSWVVRRSRTSALLRHEQGHMDITGLAAHELGRRLTRLTDTSVDGLKAKGRQTVKDFESRLEALHARYDRETDHGRSQSQQQRWEHLIADSIRDDHRALP
jgi:hypothetical protein